MKPPSSGEEIKRAREGRRALVEYGGGAWKVSLRCADARATSIDRCFPTTTTTLLYAFHKGEYFCLQKVNAQERAAFYVLASFFASLSFLLFFFLFHERSRRESFQGRRVEFDAFWWSVAITFAREVRHFRVSYPNGGPTSTTRESSF